MFYSLRIEFLPNSLNAKKKETGHLFSDRGSIECKGSLEHTIKGTNHLLNISVLARNGLVITCIQNNRSLVSMLQQLTSTNGYDLLNAFKLNRYFCIEYF